MPPGPDTAPLWFPHTDVFLDSLGDFVIKVELASMRRENLELSIDGQRLRVAGRRPDADRETAGSQYLGTEISCGSFELVMEVPPNFDLRNAKAMYQNGLLRVVIPPRSCH